MRKQIYTPDTYRHKGGDISCRVSQPRIVSGGNTRKGIQRGANRLDENRAALLVVVLEPEVSNQVLAAQVPQRVLELHQLDKDVVFGIKTRRSHG